MAQARTQPESPAGPLVAGVDGAIFLGGGLQLPPLAKDLGSPLCLPQTAQLSVYEVWLDAFKRVGIESERVLVLTDWDGAQKWERSGYPASIVLDQTAYRGPAGVLRDASAGLADPGPRLIIEHTRLLESPDLLGGLARAHAAGCQAITLAANPDQSFAGLLIADQHAIDLIPNVGFMDIKEQWLPAAWRNGFSVERFTLEGWCYQIRTLADYIEALSRTAAFGVTEEQLVLGRERSALQPTAYGGGLVSHEAMVDPSAVLARSAIGPNATVEPGAVVIRSLVPRGATVLSGSVVIDSVVTGAGVPTRHTNWERG
jgi:hypothetical protein